MPDPGAAEGGFTLVELAVVVGIVALLLAVAIPQLVPSILFSTLEGSARHLAGYGRAAMAHAVITHERLTIRIELTPEDGAPQQYWAVRWYTEEELQDEEDEGDAIKPLPERLVTYTRLLTGSTAIPSSAPGGTAISARFWAPVGTRAFLRPPSRKMRAVKSTAKP